MNGIGVASLHLTFIQRRLRHTTIVGCLLCQVENRAACLTTFIIHSKGKHARNFYPLRRFYPIFSVL